MLGFTMLEALSPAEDLDPGAEVRFETSGHTAMPVAWFRTHEQLEREVRMLLGPKPVSPGLIVSFAPPHHLFGYIFSHYLSRTRSIPVLEAWRDMLAVPKLPVREHTLIVATPGCWRILQEMSHHDDPALWKVIHSGGVVPLEASPLIESITRRGAEVLEILGATETGAVATRTASSDPEKPWCLVGDVDLIGTSPSHTLLSVASPRIGRRQDMKVPPPCWTLPDLIDVLQDGRHFQYIGREGRFVKVDGRRCPLEAVESRLRALPAIQDVACIARFSQVRGEHYDVYFVALADSRAEKDLNAEILRACQGFPSPRVVKQVEAIPKNALGKVLFGKMEERNV